MPKDYCLIDKFLRIVLLRRGRGAEYCDQFVCLCVRLSASISLEPLDRFFCADPLLPWLGPPLVALRYVKNFRFYG